MIQEEVAATGIAGEPENELATSAAGETPVALAERYARNGHFQVLFYSNAERRLQNGSSVSSSTSDSRH